jgi:hypothetical protein
MSKPEKLSEAEHVLRQIEKDTNGYMAGVLRAELAAKDAEIARLRAALRPFANAGKFEHYIGTFVCPGDCKRAVEVMGD